MTAPPRQFPDRGLTFDDILLLPDYTDFLPREAELKTTLAPGIAMNIPLVSAAMDTVTTAPLAIALAQEGGIGVIHKNMSVAQQATEVRKVKKFEGGVVKDPITIGPDSSLRELQALTDHHRISGVPVVEDGRLVGIITNRDLRCYADSLDTPVRNAMTSGDRLITAPNGSSQEDILTLLRRHRLEKILLVDEQSGLCGMVTWRDLDRSRQFPFACKDEEGHLRVAAAAGVGDQAEARIAALVEAGVDMLVVDTAHGHSANVIRCVEKVRRDYPKVALMAGNIATAEAALALADAGADAVKVGIGPGSICTTRVVTGVGVPQVTAISNVAAALEGRDVRIVADGGVRYSGDVAKAIAVGADAVMIGSLFAGTDESPGTLELYEGRSYKTYRGMGSIGAMSAEQGSSDRYFQDHLSQRDKKDKLVPEGIEGRVPYRGPLAAIIAQVTGGLRSSMGYTGCRTVAALKTDARYLPISSAAIVESHVHDVGIVREAPNYPRG